MARAIDNSAVGKRVKLLVDLTDYHPEFRIGVIGTVAPKYSGMSDNMFMMELQSGARLPVVYTHACYVGGPGRKPPIA